MFNRKNSLKVLLTSAALTLPSANAFADRQDPIRYVDELESCVTAIRSELDLNGVNRIRHIVTKSSPQGLAYELRLRVSTYSGGAEKAYTAYCLVTGNNEPSRLRVVESKI